jgi:hypothetical protein
MLGEDICWVRFTEDLSKVDPAGADGMLDP